MPNIFLIPNCPIKDRSAQFGGLLSIDNNPGYDNTQSPEVICSCVPLFLGYGQTGAKSRFEDFLPNGFRNIYKRHPASIGKRKGVNTPEHGLKMMDVSATFVGNFVLAGVCRDGAGSVLQGVNVKLFRSDSDVIMDTEITDSNGAFTFSMPNDSYGTYYITVSNGTASGISNLLRLKQT